MAFQFSHTDEEQDSDAVCCEESEEENDCDSDDSIQYKRQSGNVSQLWFYLGHLVGGDSFKVPSGTSCSLNW